MKNPWLLIGAFPSLGWLSIGEGVWDLLVHESTTVAANMGKTDYADRGCCVRHTLGGNRYLRRDPRPNISSESPANKARQSDAAAQFEGLAISYLRPPLMAWG
jgi:hypothetical protein